MSMLYSLVSLVSKEINEIIACSVLCFIYKKSLFHTSEYIHCQQTLHKEVYITIVYRGVSNDEKCEHT